MKALVYDAVKTLNYRDMPEPDETLGDNVIQIASVGICGSDMHAFLGHDERRPAPLILGHEAAGTVIKGPMKDKRVTINPLVNCGSCDACTEGRPNLCPNRQILSMQPREGTFAERVVMRSENLVEIPEGVSFDKAALAEPLAVCWHGVRLGVESLFKDISEAKCLVQGAGAIGVGAALSLEIFGAKSITVAEINELRRDQVAKIGPYTVVDPRDGLDPSSFDLVIDCVGFEGSRKDASALVKPGGTIIHVGLGDNGNGLDVRRITLQEITFIGVYTYTPKDFRDTAAAIFDGRFGPLDWIEIRDLADGQQAFDDILAGKVASPKIILRP